MSWIWTILVVLAALPMALQAQLTIDRPRGGEIFYTNRDTIIEVEWSGVDDTTAVRLEITDNDTRTWRLLADSIRGLRYSVRVADLAVGSLYRFRVSQVRPPDFTDNVIFREHRAPVLKGAWAPDTLSVATLSTLGYRWGTQNDTIQAEYPGVGNGVNIQWSPASDRLFVATQESATVYNRDGTVAWQPVVPSGIVHAAMDPGWTRLAVTTPDLRVHFFPYGTAVPLNTRTLTQPVNAIAWSPDGQRLAVASDDRSVRLFPAAGGLALTLNGHSINGVLELVYSNRGTRLATVGADALVIIWDAATGALLHTLNIPNEGGRSAAFTADDSVLVVGYDEGSVVHWNVADGSRRLVRKPHRNQVVSIAAAADGGAVVTASLDGTFVIHDVATGAERIERHAAAVRSVTVSPESSRVLSTSNDGTARITRFRSVVVAEDMTDPTFAISLPPPGSAVVRASGGTVTIGERITTRITLDDAVNLDVVDVDSLRITVGVNATILDAVASTVPLRKIAGGTAARLQFTVPMPATNSVLTEITFVATLGTDTISPVTIEPVEVIGTDPLFVGREGDSIIVTGQCRAGDSVRLFVPGIGTTLRAVWQNNGLQLVGTAGEQGDYTIVGVDVQGRILFESATVVRAVGSPMVIDLSGQAMPPTFYVRCTTPSETLTISVARP